MDNDFSSSLTTPYDSEYDSMNNLSFFYNETGGPSSGEGYSYLEQTILAVVAGILSLLTIFGNVLVMVSFKLDKQLQTISNYFLLSLAVADFLIGLISMPLYTLYLLLDKWPLGPFVCDTWLALDYLNSNASVLNLLVISFDRYFSVTRPLTYRVRRTTKRACLMIASTWIISLLLWPPWIFAWPYIEGKRTVPENQCYIQFLETNLYVTFGTALAAFYIPVTVMCFLYWRVWRETEKRYKDLTTLFLVSAVGGRVRTAPGHGPPKNQKKKTKGHSLSRGSSREHDTSEGEETMSRGICVRFFYCLCYPLIWVWNRFAATDDDDDEEEDVDVTVGHTSSLKRKMPSGRTGDDMTSTTEDDEACMDDYESTSGASSSKGLASDSIYTILITLGSSGQKPNPMTTPTTTSSAALTPVAESFTDETAGHSIKQFFESAVINSGHEPSSSTSSIKKTKQVEEPNSKGQHLHATRLSYTSSSRPPQTAIQSTVSQPKAEKKAAKTLSAILLAFIITWTPYNVLVLIKTLKGDSIDDEGPGSTDPFWTFSYYLCYINSTINPFIYALCNVNFRNTYIRILKCQWTLKGSRAKRAERNLDAQLSASQAKRKNISIHSKDNRKKRDRPAILTSQVKSTALKSLDSDTMDSSYFTSPSGSKRNSNRFKT